MSFDFHCFKMRTGWVLRRVKMFEMPASHMGALLQVPAPLLPTQLPANAEGRRLDAGPGFEGPTICMGDFSKVLGSWLQSGPPG